MNENTICSSLKGHYNDITLKKLTKDCHDDGNYVNNVPAILEVVLSERNDLQNDLYQEDDEEDEVYPG